MVPHSLFNGIAINLLLPLLGVIYYFYLVYQMKRKQITDQPILSLFFIFLTYGILIIIGLTFIFWQWSGMVLLGGCYLIFIAPVIMMLIIFASWEKRNHSIYHKVIFILANTLLLFAIFTFIFLRIWPTDFFAIS